jgi:hypothetical protein
MEDVMYELYFRQRVGLGLYDAKMGEKIPKDVLIQKILGSF